MYSTGSLTKASICEATIYRVKVILNRILTQFNSNDWPRSIQQAVCIFNNQKSSGLPNHLTPSEAIKDENRPIVQEFLLKRRANLAKKELKRHPKPRYKLGDKVRYNLSKAVGATLATRGFKPRFSEQIYEILKIRNTLPRQYFIGILLKNKKPRYFYANELRLASEGERDQTSVLKILKYRDKILSYLRNGKVREKVRQYLTVLNNGDKPKFLSQEQVTKYKNGREALDSFIQNGGVRRVSSPDFDTNRQ